MCQNVNELKSAWPRKFQRLSPVEGNLSELLTESWISDVFTSVYFLTGTCVEVKFKITSPHLANTYTPGAYKANLIAYNRSEIMGLDTGPVASPGYVARRGKAGN